MIKPTATPYKLIIGENHYGEKINAGIHPLDIWVEESPMSEQTLADLRFIVTACNSHGALLEALTAIEQVEGTVTVKDGFAFLPDGSCLDLGQVRAKAEAAS